MLMMGRKQVYINIPTSAMGAKAISVSYIQRASCGLRRGGNHKDRKTSCIVASTQQYGPYMLGKARGPLM